MLEDMVHTVLSLYESVPSDDAMAAECDNYILVLVGFFFFAFVLQQTFLYKSYP